MLNKKLLITILLILLQPNLIFNMETFFSVTEKAFSFTISIMQIYSYLPESNPLTIQEEAAKQALFEHLVAKGRKKLEQEDKEAEEQLEMLKEIDKIKAENKRLDRLNQANQALMYFSDDEKRQFFCHGRKKLVPNNKK